MAERPEAPCIYVLAGTNGAGKSSVGGMLLLKKGTEFFNPDEATRSMMAADPTLSMAEANSRAWLEGKRLLEHVIANRLNFAIETTLGGNTIPALLESALDAGLEVRVWYVALKSPELHIKRVEARVKRGGHDIPEQKIRERYDKSRENLIHLLPRLTELWVYDNSADADPHAGATPEPLLILHWADSKVIKACKPAATPAWAKPILIVSMMHGRK